MVRCQCNLLRSRRVQGITLLLHGGVMLALLLAPWPSGASPIGVILLLLVLYEGRCSLRRTRSWHGLFLLHDDHVVQWQQQRWRMVSPPWLSRQAVRLSLQDRHGRQVRLWLFADGMKNSEWRLLRQQLLSKKGMPG